MMHSEDHVDDPIVGLYEEAALRSIAKARGWRGPAAAAVQDADARRRRGENVTFYKHASGCVSVGPVCQEIIEKFGEAHGSSSKN